MTEGEGEVALCFGDGEVVEGNGLGDAGLELKAVEGGDGYDDDVEGAVVELFDAFFDVAADGVLGGVGKVVGGVVGAAVGADADDGVGGEVLKGLPGAEDEGVAGVFGVGEPAPVEGFGYGVGEVFGAVEGAVDGVVEEGLVEFVGEEVGGAVAEVGGAVGVAFCGEGLDLEAVGLELLFEVVECVARLLGGELTRSGSNLESCG